MSVADDAKAMYGQFLSKEDRALVESLEYPEQVYFWTLLYYEIPTHLSKSILKDMESDVARGRARMRTVIKRIADSKAGLMDEAWEPTKPHAWFKTIVR